MVFVTYLGGVFDFRDRKEEKVAIGQAKGGVCAFECFSFEPRAGFGGDVCPGLT